MDVHSHSLSAAVTYFNFNWHDTPLVASQTLPYVRAELTFLIIVFVSQDCLA